MDVESGVRKGRSTVDPFLYAVLTKDVKWKENNCAYIDLKETIERINLHCVWYKLFRQGLNGEIIQLIKDIYNNLVRCKGV